MEKQTCPRRVGEMGPWNRGELLDTWNTRNGEKCCSFCGSLHPETFLKNIEEGVPMGTTTKDYKAYLHGVGSQKFYFQHFRNEDRSKFVELYNERKIKFEGDYPFEVFPFFFRFEPEEAADNGTKGE